MRNGLFSKKIKKWILITFISAITIFCSVYLFGCFFDGAIILLSPEIYAVLGVILTMMIGMGSVCILLARKIDRLEACIEKIQDLMLQNYDDTVLLIRKTQEVIMKYVDRKNRK